MYSIAAFFSQFFSRPDRSLRPFSLPWSPPAASPLYTDKRSYLFSSSIKVFFFFPSTCRPSRPRQDPPGPFFSQGNRGSAPCFFFQTCADGKRSFFPLCHVRLFHALRGRIDSNRGFSPGRGSNPRFSTRQSRGPF